MKSVVFLDLSIVKDKDTFVEHKRTTSHKYTEVASSKSTHADYRGSKEIHNGKT